MTIGKNTSPNSEFLPPLAQHRIHNGVTLDQIEKSTKISMRFLRAIESEEYSILPGGIFARSYIRQYAAAIGFDEEELLARYQRTIGDDGAKTDPSGNLRKPASSDHGRKRSGLGLLRSLSSIRFL
jgi:cytoskeletal protein RodZ